MNQAFDDHALCLFQSDGVPPRTNGHRQLSQSPPAFYSLNGTPEHPSHGHGHGHGPAHHNLHHPLHAMGASLDTATTYSQGSIDVAGKQ